MNGKCFQKLKKGERAPGPAAGKGRFSSLKAHAAEIFGNRKRKRLREQTVGVKRFSLAGTTVSLCKIKEMGVHIPRRSKGRPLLSPEKAGAHIPPQRPKGRLPPSAFPGKSRGRISHGTPFSPGESHGRLSFKGVSPNCGFAKTSHYSQKEVKI